jgi:HD-GYP domain-containing protein (c-di-GMP phosphodiesterase class II)
LGWELLEKTVGIPEIAKLITLQHHERYDGTGYPKKLTGDQISQFGQIASIIDVYDALTSDRAYHTGTTPAEALKKLFEWGRFHFDESLVHQFIRCVGIYPVGTLVSLESGKLAVVVKPGKKDMLHPTVRVIFDKELDMPINPHDIDLALSIGSVGGDHILKSEIPEKWEIDPYRYLGIEHMSLA